ncbi:bactofilin family protein [Acetobacter orientalis]|uniref:bactofilin family protein n=1 Tax=Acetobacter orientalis TaxID=146474 RepID=UPI0039EA38BE
MAGVFLFKRRKPEETKPAASSSGQNASQPGAGNPAGAFGSLFSSSSSSGATPPASGSGNVPTSTRPDAAKETSMGRAPLPPGSPLSPGSAMPPIPGAGRGLPQQAQPKKDVPEQRTLVVGRGISVQGTVQDAERLVVEGTVESSMISAKELVVMPGGLFRGGVEVESAEIAGTVDGSLTARGGLTLRATGRLLGKAACRRLKVEDGGQITGQLEMLTDDSSANKPSVTAPAADKASEG